MVRAWTTASKYMKAFRTGLILIVLSNSSTSVLYLREGGTGVAVLIRTNSARYHGRCSSHFVDTSYIE